TLPTLTPLLFPYTTLFRSVLMDVVSDHVRTVDRMREELVLRASSRVTILEEFNTIVVPYGFSGRLQRRESDLRLICNVFRVLVRSEEHTSELQSRFDLVCR